MQQHTKTQILPDDPGASKPSIWSDLAAFGIVIVLALAIPLLIGVWS